MVDVTDGKLKLESKCEDDPCFGSWSRINSIEISKIDTNNSDDSVT